MLYCLIKAQMRFINDIGRIITGNSGFILVGGHILLLDQDANIGSLEDEDVDMIPELKLNSPMVLIGVEAQPGQPDVVKVARNGC
jgi:hypothetical protein